MKTTLFLVLAGGSFALCNCQQQNEPVAPTTEATAPIVVTPVKTVDMSGGLAPESIVGTYITLWEPGASAPSYEFDFKTVNAGFEGNEKITYTYTKTGPKTATLTGGGKVYNLTFTSSTKGKVSGDKYATKFVIGQDY